MSPLTKSLEKRIQELKLSIEAQRTEMIAYERVLELESGKVVTASGEPTGVVHHTAPAAMVSTGKDLASELPYNGSRSDFVSAILKHRGTTGATPQEIGEVFVQRKIPISKNLIYNVVSLLFKRKKVRKSNGRYFLSGKETAAAMPAAKPAAAPRKGATKPAVKRRISEEGMKRIIAATKKRWAKQRAAQAKAKKA